MSIAEQIFAADDLKRELVVVPEWGFELQNPLFIRTMTGRERDEFEADVLRRTTSGPIDDVRGVKAWLVVTTLVDASGAAVFETGDAERLEAKSALVIDRLVAVSQRLNGLTNEDVEELKND